MGSNPTPSAKTDFVFRWDGWHGKQRLYGILAIFALLSFAMALGPDKKPSVLRDFFAFYFARRWQSFLTIFYFATFSYFAVFYLGNLWLSAKFVAYTIANSGQLLALSYLFWGVAFLVALLIPFAASVYALILCFEICTSDWTRRRRVLGTVMLITAAFVIIISADEIIRVVAEQPELSEFVTTEQLHIDGAPVTL